MKQSDNIGEIAASLAKAQFAMKGAIADSNNPHFKSRYADLDSVRGACVPALAANGIAVVQGLADSKCITRLVHASGQWIETEVPLIIAKNDMQGVGSAITYARRYGLAAAVCLSQTDDDANAACEQPRPIVKAARPVEKTILAPTMEVPPGLLTDGPIDENPTGTSAPFKAKPQAPVQYLDDDESKRWLMRELEFYGVGKRLFHYNDLCAEVHQSCVGLTKAVAQSKIAAWADHKGFKRG